MMPSFSGEGLLVATCENLARAEIGFVGRVLLNAFNALEYGQQNNRSELVANSYAVFDSYLDHGFTANGLFREHVNYDKDVETSIFSIRRQSEGVYAMFQFLQYEKNNGRRHPEWETKLQTLLDRMLLLQNEDGSFPRKFTDNLVISDASGGSTPSVTLPLVMAYRYFNNPKYLTASWYYLWDVPFAQGQMIGDNGLQTRGWGNFTILWRWCNILTGTMARTEKGFITIFLLRDGP